MSRLKNMSRAGYIVVGIVAALILVPTGIAAATVAYTGIEGTNGSTTTVNHADVTSAGQLLTTEASPSSFVQTGDVTMNPSNYSVVAQPAAGHALIVTWLHYDVYADPSPGADQNLYLVEETGSTCSGSQVGSWYHFLNPATDGETDISLSPGLVVAKGDSICGLANGSVIGEVSVSGYSVSSTDAPTGSARHLAMPRQR
jgi:hypothetical protein